MRANISEASDNSKRWFNDHAELVEILSKEIKKPSGGINLAEIVTPDIGVTLA